MVPDTFKGLVEIIYSDFVRINPHVPYHYNLKMILHLFKWGWNVWTFWFRCAQYPSWWQPLAKRRYKKLSLRFLIEIPLKTEVGYGLYLGHPRCIAVNAGTVIGNNVNLSQYLNIGTNHNTPAVIGDCVYIGPMCCLVENVKIGNNATVGAGAVVVKDVEENATVAGVPAHVLNYNNPGRFIQNKWSPQS